MIHDAGLKMLIGRRVLIVEDNFLLALDLEGALADLGCEVLSPARSVRQALSMLTSEAPELVTLDLDLNGESSIPVAQALVDMQIPFVIVSGNAPEDRQHALFEQAPSLMKPFNADDLASAMSDVCLRTRSH